jgi:hypothetical protein
MTLVSSGSTDEIAPSVKVCGRANGRSQRYHSVDPGLGECRRSTPLRRCRPGPGMTEITGRSDLGAVRG